MADKNGMTYKGSGVDYNAMDPFKRMAQLAARETACNLHRFNFREVEESRGESAYLIETPWGFLAHVEEGLGTKNLVADAMLDLLVCAEENIDRSILSPSYYDKIAQCTVAMIVNDIITVGALPLSVCMHLGVGLSKWFENEGRLRELIEGWKEACNLARCVWGGGETPTLKDMISPQTAVLSGSAMGFIKPKKRLMLGSKIKEGDAVILLASSGIHANGLTLARSIAKELPFGYHTQISDGQMYGLALLTPTTIYVPVLEDCFNEGVKIHYAVNITGHGWRKLMRARAPFVYILDYIPEPQAIFKFIQTQGRVSDQEMYGNFNMGAGFALYVPQTSVPCVTEIAKRHGICAIDAGHIEKRGNEKKVVINPKGLEYSSETLGVR